MQKNKTPIIRQSDMAPVCKSVEDLARDSLHTGMFYNADTTKYKAEQTPLTLYHYHSSITDFNPQLLS